MKNTKIKLVLVVLLISGLSFNLNSCKPAENTNAELEKTIVQVVKAFQENDAATLNKMISPDKGLTILFRRGVLDEFVKLDKIDFANPVPDYNFYAAFTAVDKVVFESLPTFDCESMKWSKSGLFCDTTVADQILSTAALNQNEFGGQQIAETDINAMKELEKNSKRVVLSDAQGGELVFYLTKINDQWFLTIVDRVTSDCSA